MKPSVYLETTICSYLTAWPMREIVAAARQQLTADWWHDRREPFELFVSDLVIDEASAGDADAAARRLALIKGIAVLPSTEDSATLALRLLTETGFPPRARADADHIAVAAVHGIDYLLTWNMTHIANAEFGEAIRDVCLDAGFPPPKICTPEELMGLRSKP
jgi:hypothetical protein